MITVETRPTMPPLVTTRIQIVVGSRVFSESSQGWKNLEDALYGVGEQASSFADRLNRDMLKSFTPARLDSILDASERPPLPPQ